MYTKTIVTFITAFIVGALMWWLSEPITGHVEAFDAIFYYTSVLVIAGIISFSSPLAGYGGVFSGQLLIFLPADGALWPIGLVFIVLLRECKNICVSGILNLLKGNTECQYQTNLSISF